MRKMHAEGSGYAEPIHARSIEEECMLRGEERRTLGAFHDESGDL